MKSFTEIFFNSNKILKDYEPSGARPSDKDMLKRTLQVAWPSMLESFLIAVVGVIDTLMVSQLGDYAIAAVGLTIQPKMLGLAVFFALSAAVSALVARRKGEGDRESAVRVLKMSLIITAVLTAIVTFISVYFADEIVHLVGSEPETHEFAVEYIQIIMGGIVFNVFSMVINAAQRGTGNTKIAMRTNLTSNLVNVVFNYLLIGGKLGFPALGVRGAAIATVIGTVVAFGMSVASVLHRDGYIYLGLKTERIYEARSAKSLVSIGSSTFMEQVFLRFGFLVFAVIIASLGMTAFSTHQIGMNMMTISFAFGDGLSVAAVALVGYSLGEKRPDMAQIYGSYCQRCGVICSSFLSLVFIFLGRQIFMLFSDTPQIIEDGALIMKILTVIVFFQISQVIYSGCLRGSGDAKFTALVSFLNIGILRPAIAFLVCNILNLGLVGAWVGIAVDQLVRLIMTSIRFKRGKWMKLKI